jgi:hypothetical protein
VGASTWHFEWQARRELHRIALRPFRLVHRHDSLEWLLGESKASICDPGNLTRHLLPTSGSLVDCLPINTGDYLDLVDWTGWQLREGKRGAIPINAPHALILLDTSDQRWAT